MSLFWAAFGLGLGYLGLQRRQSAGGGSPPADTTGQPMGLLLALTYAS
jgi:hypothetical protein